MILSLIISTIVLLGLYLVAVYFSVSQTECGWIRHSRTNRFLERNCRQTHIQCEDYGCEVFILLCCSWEWYASWTRRTNDSPGVKNYIYVKGVKIFCAWLTRSQHDSNLIHISGVWSELASANSNQTP